MQNWIISLSNPGIRCISSNTIVWSLGREFKKLLITNFEDKHELEKIGNNLFKPNEGVIGEPIETAGIVQGFLETSNINPVSEMVNLIDMHRKFEATQKVMRTFDEISNDAVNDVGDV